MPYIHEDFLLESKAARRLYHEHAVQMPIIDYHNHLPVADIASNRRFRNLFEIWLEGDHYKWRAMRANGISEEHCTGSAKPYEKFRAWARTVPYTLRNPLYHWTHLELKRYFGIDGLLSEKTAAAVWEEANEKLGRPKMRVEGILRKFNVAALCTTDDPADDLRHHRALASAHSQTRVYPAYRPDRAFMLDNPTAFNAYLDKLAAASDVEIDGLAALLDALEKRHSEFHDLGCRLSDHGLPHCYCDFPSDAKAASIFDSVRAGKRVSAADAGKFISYMMAFFGRLDSRRGWTMQLHLGPLRNNNSRAFGQLGPDTGFDSIGDFPQAAALASFLDHLECEQALPRTILYNNNPNDNYVLATMAGNFQDGITPGKIQFGASWWHLDTKSGIEAQINALSNTGLLARFVGMLTDSRSFMSFPRHEYFRRILCNLIGADIERGEIPGDLDFVGGMIRNICYQNAQAYLNLAVSEGTPK